MVVTVCNCNCNCFNCNIRTVEAYENAKVNTITVKNKELFWVKMIDVQDRLGLKYMSDLLRKEMCGISETKDLTEKQKQIYIKSENQITKKPTDNHKYKYARSDIIEKIIKNCRGVKKCNDGVNRTKKIIKEKTLDLF